MEIGFIQIHRKQIVLFPKPDLKAQDKNRKNFSSDVGYCDLYLLLDTVCFLSCKQFLMQSR